MTQQLDVIVAITGASGVAYGVRALQELRVQGIKSHLIVSKASRIAINEEMDIEFSEIERLAAFYYAVGDVGARIASGSFITRGMLIAPCSVKTMSEVATGVTSNLISRAADVTLKERRRLVVLLRETPLHLGHLRSMVSITEMGGVIMPPVPALYTRPKSVQEIVDNTVGRALDMLGIHSNLVQRWDGTGKH